MNTRLQVEHPVTEWVWGIDLVQAQIRIAAGEPLGLAQDDLRPRGHAIECRVYAEDPAAGFLPRPGRIAFLQEPHGPGIRVDSGITADYQVPIDYDPMLSKLSVWSGDRESARRRMVQALRQYVVLGVTTSVPFLIDILQHPAFASADTHTHFVDSHFSGWQGARDGVELAALAAALHVTLATPPAPAVDGARPHRYSPWETLGAWRVGDRKP
jgi:acetyl/propionyl-CoA carboxylase alpha subunit